MRTIAILLTLAGSCSGFEITFRGRTLSASSRFDEATVPAKKGDTLEFTYVASEYWTANRRPGQTNWYFDIVDMYGRTFNDRGDGWIEWDLHRRKGGVHVFRFSDNSEWAGGGLGEIRDGFSEGADGYVAGAGSSLNVYYCDESGCQKQDYQTYPHFLYAAATDWFDGIPDVRNFVLPEQYKQCGGVVSPVGVCPTSVEFKWPEPGDANQDFSFDEMDIVQVAEAGKYSTAQWATWGEGDWNADGLFDNLDIVAALSTGNYNQGAYAAAVPEPSTVVLLIVCMAMLSRRRLR